MEQPEKTGAEVAVGSAPSLQVVKSIREGKQGAALVIVFGIIV